MENKLNKKIIIFLIIIIVILIGVIITLFNFNNKNLNNSVNNQNPDDVKDEIIKDENDSNDDDKIASNENDKDELNNQESNTDQDNYSGEIKGNYNSNVYFMIDETDNSNIKIENNEIIIDDTHKISNIKNIKEFKKSTSKSLDNQLLYILDNDGYIYEYVIGSDTNKAIKLEEFKNIEKLISVKKRSNQPMGGCDYIFAVDKDEKFYQVNSYCI